MLKINVINKTVSKKQREKVKNKKLIRQQRLVEKIDDIDDVVDLLFKLRKRIKELEDRVKVIESNATSK